MKKLVISTILLICTLILSVNVVFAAERSISINPFGIILGISNGQYEVNGSENATTTYRASIISINGISGWEFDYGSRKYAKEAQNSGYFGIELGCVGLNSRAYSWASGIIPFPWI